MGDTGSITIERKHMKIPIYSAIIMVISIIMGTWKVTTSITQATEVLKRLEKRMNKIETMDVKTRFELIEYRIKILEKSSLMSLSKIIDGKKE